MFNQKKYQKENRWKYKGKYKEYQLWYNKKRRKQLAKRQKKVNLEIKKLVLMYYGNGKLECTLCGYKNIVALSLDHISGNGAEDRKKTGKSGQMFYRHLIKNKFPGGLRTLCMNCQWIEKDRLANLKIVV